MMRRIEKGILILLIIIFGFLCLVSYIRSLDPFRYDIRKLSENGVLWVFEEHFDEFDETAQILWNHPDFFEYIHEPLGDWRLGGMSNTTIDYENYGMFFTDEEWEKVRNTYLLMEPSYFSMNGFFMYRYFRVVDFLYITHDENGNAIDVKFYYIDCDNYEPGDFYFMDAVRELKTYRKNLDGAELKNIISPKWYYTIKYRS